MLLARIAAGEGMGLLPESFSAIRQRGMAFVPLAGNGLLRLELGIVAEEDKTELMRRLAQGACVRHG